MVGVGHGSDPSQFHSTIREEAVYLTKFSGHSSHTHSEYSTFMENIHMLKEY